MTHNDSVIITSKITEVLKELKHNSMTGCRH